MGVSFSLLKKKVSLVKEKKPSLLPFKFANGIAFYPNYKTQSLERIKKKEKCHSQSVPFLECFTYYNRTTRERERIRDLPKPNLLGTSRWNLPRKIQLHLLSQRTGFDHSTVRSASIWVFQSVHVSGSLPSLLTSQQAMEHPPKERQCLCSLLVPPQAECKRTWWGKGPLFHSASHKPPIELPVSKHSPTPSSFHAIYSMHIRNTNWTKPCQSHFLSKGLCKQNQLAIIMCVVLTARKAFTSSAEMTVFPLWTTTPSSKQFLYTGVREEVLLSSLIPTRKQFSHSCTIKAIWWLCCASLAITASHHHDGLADQQL